MHVIIGAGAIGSRTALLLAERGEQVRVITRSGGGPKAAGIELIAADATDANRLTELAQGAAAIYNCANPPYHAWLTDWPPLAAAILQAAEKTGAVLVIMGNLYGYGPVTGTITEQTPLAATHPKLRVRAKMWEDALAAHQAGRVRVTEARASDFVGFEVNSGLSEMVLKLTAKGKTSYAFGDLDAPHSWTNVDDVARTLVALAGDERAWGRAWHVPTAPAMSIRQAALRTHELIGLPEPKITRMPYPVLWTMGLFHKMLKEFRTTYYQFAGPFVLDSAAVTKTFGIEATPLDESLAATGRAYRDL